MLNKLNSMEKAIKVLFISRKWFPAIGGMETYSMELTAALSHHTDLTVRALPGRKGGRPPSLPRLLWFMVSSLYFLWLNRQKYDVIHFGDMVLFPLVFFHHFWDAKSKKVLTIHGLDILYGRRKGIKAKLYGIFLLWVKKYFTRVDYYITNSKNTSRIAEKQGFFPTIAIPLGVRFKNRLNVSEPIEAKENQHYILFVGRLVRRKGAKWFAEKVLPFLSDNISMYVVGKVWDKDEAQALQKNSRVKYFGYVSENKLNILRKNALLMIMPNIKTLDGSDVEGFGIAALEAAAQGIPLVAADLEGITDAVRHKETGFLVPAEDIKAWVDQIYEILLWPDSFRNEFALKAQHAVQKYYSWDRVALDTMNLYLRLL